MNLLPNGQGEYRWKDGRVYIGQFEFGMENGQGTLTYPDGKEESGEWKYGEFIG